MPIIPTTSSSDLTYKIQRRMLYAHRILKEQSFAQGQMNRIDLVSGNAGVNSESAILPMKVGAYFTTPEERDKAELDIINAEEAKEYQEDAVRAANFDDLIFNINDEEDDDTSDFF